MAAVILLASGCAHRMPAPAAWQWGLPVYPASVMQGRTDARASVALYRTSDSFEDVDAWYLASLPPGTAHARNAEGKQATFALFDERSRRTVHIQAEGTSTVILLTRISP